ncbi:haloacid dehalogenase [Geotalea uraniireducens]|uniref:phosphoglycolate phosphatase n=1 Tax=Geotalea uraniireducens TaxID=351604 RepID=A0ABN6VYP2_9BACT|nr:haloacid dehalogenase [Geotalea uraniireducens]
MQVKAVIYDCDGVMFDSFEANLAFYAKVLENFGLALDRGDTETMRILHTYSNRDVMEYLFAGDPRREEAIRLAGTIDYRELVPLMRMEAGFRETLEQLRSRVSLAVCTNRSTSMELVLETFGLKDYFGCVMTAARVRNPKPHPEPLHKVLEHFSLTPEEALFVGDSEVDRAAAAAAGVPFVAYRAEYPACRSIYDHREIVSLLS